VKPSELYAMPDMAIEPWYDDLGFRLDRIFGVDLYDVDTRAAEEANDQRIVLRQKMRAEWGDEGTAAVYAVTFDGKPYGIYLEAGEGDFSKSRFLVTDRHIQAQAQQHVMSWANKHEIGEGIDEGFDLISFGGLGGYATVVKSGDGYRLVGERFVTDEGVMLLDETALADAIGRRFVISGRVVADRDGADLIAASIPEGLRSLVVNDIDAPGTGFGGRWIAAVVATDEGTYALHTNGGFSDASDLSCERIGGEDLFDRFVERYGATASLPTP